MTVVLPNTSKTIADTNLFSDVYANDLALKTAVDALQATAAGTGTDIPDSGLASANNSVYKTIERGGGFFAAIPTGTYWFRTDGAPIASAGGTGNSWGFGSAFYFDDADYSVGSLTQKLRLRVQLYTNTVAPTSTFTFGIYPIASVGGIGDQISLTFGTVVSGTTVAYVAPSASTRYPTSSATGFSTDATIPADGHYTVGCVISAFSMAATSLTVFNYQVQTRSV